MPFVSCPQLPRRAPRACRRWSGLIAIPATGVGRTKPGAKPGHGWPQRCRATGLDHPGGRIGGPARVTNGTPAQRLRLTRNQIKGLLELNEDNRSAVGQIGSQLIGSQLIGTRLIGLFLRPEPKDLT
jgi:hypothetical protein